MQHRFTLRDACPVAGTSTITLEGGGLPATPAAGGGALPCRTHSREPTWAWSVARAGVFPAVCGRSSAVDVTCGILARDQLGCAVILPLAAYDQRPVDDRQLRRDVEIRAATDGDGTMRLTGTGPDLVVTARSAAIIMPGR